MAKKTQKLAPAVTSRAVKVKKRLLNAAVKNPQTLLIQYDNTAEGYDEEKIEDMREMYGTNAISRQKEATIFKRLFDAFVNPFSIVLFIIAVISLATEDLAAFTIVISMVMIGGVLRFVQEHRSRHSAEKLTEMVETTVAVQRVYEDEDTEEERSERREIPLDELVVGDVVYLAAGDIIPADIRILQAKDLFISQSSLTGESEPVEKFEKEITGKPLNPLDLNNLAFMGSNVISGSATALALAVGDDTVFGNIAKQLQVKKEPTSFEKGINSVSWVLIRFMAAMVPLVFFVNGFRNGWLGAFMFAVSIAVGLTPEMLPMIVASNLAKGAVTMSKKKVIVKDLNSIQNFGAMDVLCTDKTGTITQDKVILEYHLDIHGNEDERVLRHAFLNSYYQTGLKNLMDVSIIEYAEKHKVKELWENHTKIDEIPFDFNRRRMSVVVAAPDGKTQLITKGAIEEMLSISSFVEYEGMVEPITDEIRREVLRTCRKYNKDGLRVLGVAQKTNPSPAGAFSVADESDMVLIGYLAFLDPPKESAEEAVAALHEYGVSVKVLTGDNDAVTKSVCRQVKISVENILLGSDIEAMDDGALKKAIEVTDVFAKLSPQQKARVVTALRENGHTVGYMGDGINDAMAMKAADVGISVDTAVDIAKESANIILLEKDLMVLEQGMIEGRKIYANIIKYIKMTASSNFGNMFSVLAASIFLPFLPMLPIQILALNLIYDISCLTVPWDNVDMEYLRKPRKWDSSSITKFMLWLGPSSSVFDITTYALMFFIICPMVAGGAFNTLNEGGQALFIMLFHAGWFVESLWSQTLIIHLIRTPKMPFIRSRASWQLTLLTSAGIAVGTVLPFTFAGRMLKMAHLPLVYFPYLIATIACYMVLTTLLKKIFIRRYGELL
ncbi:MAG: magnesium-translocating P-type ATPase [Oscillospiraceae bacterium]|nr:magnesium-translocating P-type ATPase [Oscillospiraceae bacterium]